MSIQDEMAADINNIFFNADEFGETHRLEGIEVNSQLQTLLAKEGSDITQTGEALFIIPADTCPITDRNPDDLINIDGQEYRIIKWDNQKGVLFIELAKNIGY